LTDPAIFDRPTVDLYTSKKGYLVPWHYVAGAFLASDPIAHSRHGHDDETEPNNTINNSNENTAPPAKEDKKSAIDLSTLFIVRCGHIEPLPLKKSTPPSKKLIKIPKQPEFKILNFKFTCKDSATATAWVNKINAELERQGQSKSDECVLDEMLFRPIIFQSEDSASDATSTPSVARKRHPKCAT
jgi:hypothetical protein